MSVLVSHWPSLNGFGVGLPKKIDPLEAQTAVVVMLMPPGFCGLP